MAHTPTARTPSEDAGCMPAKTQAITTPPANMVPTPPRQRRVDKLAAMLAFLSVSEDFFSAQNEHFRRRTSASSHYS